MELLPDELLAKLYKGELPPGVVVVYGEENYYRLAIAQAMEKAVFGATPKEERQLDSFERDTNLAELSAAINTYPFFSGISMVIISDEKLWSGKAKNGKDEGLSDTQKKKLEELALLLNDVPDYCHVLINCTKIDGRLKLFKDLKKDGVMCSCEGLRPDKIGPWLDREAALLGGRLDNQAKFAIIQYLAPVDKAPLALLHQELAKLPLYAGERKSWTREDVKAVFADLPESGSFKLIEALAQGNLTLAMRLLAMEQQKGTYILPLCGLILFQLRRLLSVKELMNQHKTQQMIAGDLKLAPFQVKIAMTQCQRFSEAKLRQALLDVAQINFDLRNGGRSFTRLEEIFITLLDRN